MKSSGGYDAVFRFLFLILFPVILMGCGKVRLPSVFSDNMVLQQKSEVPIWGWARPGRKVTVLPGWSQEKYEAVADGQARWEVKVSTPQAGGPYEIIIRTAGEMTIKNVMIGEVWLCAGQSNMEMSAKWGIPNGPEEVKNANYPNIRFFKIRHRTAETPQTNLEGKWTTCTPETMNEFSAAAYFFAKKLQAEAGVPIGLIQATWGSTPAEIWMPAHLIRQDSLLAAATKLLPEKPWGAEGIGKLYNSMIAPITRFKIAGTIWYQGESNVENAGTYKVLFPKLIRTWRELWGDNFPFFFAQIAPFPYPIPHSGAIIRDAQRQALALPNTAMIVTSDIGDTTDIHPKNKLDVGLRFAGLALKYVYRQTDEEFEGPLFKDYRIEQDRIRIYFDHADGLYAKDGPPTNFEIAGDDEVFHPAQAVIEGNTVVVNSAKVGRPLKVRFAWGNTAMPNFFNAANLPASCFITEN